MLADGSILWEDIRGNMAVDRMADEAANRHNFPMAMHHEAIIRRDVTVAVQQHLVRSWILWCDLHREAREQVDSSQLPPVVSQAEDFEDIAKECHGQFVDDWLDDVEKEDDPFCHLETFPVSPPPIDDEEWDPPFGFIDLDGNDFNSKSTTVHVTGPVMASTRLSGNPVDDTSEGVRGGMGLPADEVPTETPSVGPCHSVSSLPLSPSVELSNDPASSVVASHPPSGVGNAKRRDSPHCGAPLAKVSKGTVKGYMDLPSNLQENDRHMTPKDSAVIHINDVGGLYCMETGSASSGTAPPLTTQQDLPPPENLLQLEVLT